MFPRSGVYYDDNFGHWENTDDPDVLAFYRKVQAESVEKKCEGCGRTVRLRPSYGFCDPCATKREQGFEY